MRLLGHTASFSLHKVYRYNLKNLNKVIRNVIKMKIEILYTNKSRHIKPVAEAMARWVKTYAKSIDDFDDCN